MTCWIVGVGWLIKRHLTRRRYACTFCCGRSIGYIRYFGVGNSLWRAKALTVPYLFLVIPHIQYPPGQPKRRRAKKVDRGPISGSKTTFNFNNLDPDYPLS